jgi:hypothetical protein
VSRGDAATRRTGNIDDDDDDDDDDDAAAAAAALSSMSSPSSPSAGGASSPQVFGSPAKFWKQHSGFWQNVEKQQQTSSLAWAPPGSSSSSPSSSSSSAAAAASSLSSIHRQIQPVVAHEIYIRTRNDGWLVGRRSTTTTRELFVLLDAKSGNLAEIQDEVQRLAQTYFYNVYIQ